MKFNLKQKSAVSKVAKTRKDSGFSLIELSVVLVVSGVLAAIAVPVYTNVQNNAKNSSTVSDITLTKTAIMAFIGDSATNALPDAIDSTTLGKFGFALSANTTSLGFSVPTTATASPVFCLVAVSAGGKTYYATNSTPVSTTKHATLC